MINLRGSYSIIVLIVVSLFFTTNSAFATVTIVPASGSIVPGCEETSSGCFIPSAVVVDVGEKIIFLNTDTAAHTWTANNGEFDTSLIMPGGSYEYSPNSWGDIPYFCMIHPWMQGLIIVQGDPSVQYYSLDLNIFPTTVMEDEIAVISGQLTSSAPITGYEVSVKLTTDTGLTSTIWVLDGGHFEMNVVWPVGVHTVTATFDGDSGTLVSNSVVLTIKTPDLPGTIITLDSSKSSITTDEAVILFSGQLVDENGIPISGKTIFVQGNSDTGRGQGKSAITDSSGRYTAEFDNWTENDVGNWIIYAEFEGDSQYKKSSSNTRQLEVTLPEPVYANVSFTNPRSVDAFGNVLTNIEVFQQIQIATDVTNHSNFSQDFAYYISIRETEVEAWITGSLSSGQSFTPALSWIPTETGTFTVDISLFDNIENKHKLSESVTLQIIVTESEPELTCEAGTELVNGICQAIPPSISAWSDKSSYTEGDIIKISGKVTNPTSTSVVNIILKAPDGNLVMISQVDLNYDHAFSTSITTGGNLMDESGTYQFDVGYESVSDSGSFYYSTPTISLINVSTDRSEYEEGDIIVVSGNVSIIIESTPVTFQLFLEDSLVDIVQITVAQDGTFSHTTIAEGSLWKESGNYLVRVSYGEGTIAETTFNYSPKTTTLETTAIFEVNAGSRGTFDVEYTINGGTIKNMIIDSSIFALIVQIESTDDGTISLDLPREFIVAEKQDGTDDTFIILIDGKEVAYQESVVHSDSRTLAINFEKGNSEIEIVGTSLAPTPAATISISTDKSSYTTGDTINVSGSISPITQNIALTYVITNPEGDIITIDQLILNSDGTFEFSLNSDGPLWELSGTHTIKAGYGTIVADTTFTFTTSAPGVLGDEHVHASILVQIFGDEFDFSGPDFQIKSSQIHFEERDGKTIHRHESGVTLGYLFETLGIVLDDQCYVFPDGKSFCTNEDYVLEFFINQQQVTNITNYVFSEGDEISIIFEAYLGPVPPIPSGIDVEIPFGSSFPGCEQSNSCWIPSSIFVDVGDTVTWYNADTVAHTVTGGSPADGPSGVFDSSVLLSDSTFEVTFTQDGTYPYFCMVHPWQIGTVIVGDGGGPIVDPTISVSTDKSSYTTGDTINVSGSVSQDTQNLAVSLLITNPEGDVLTITQLIPNSDGTFEFSFNTGGPLWELSGTHTIKAGYGTAGSETTFTFTSVPKISASVLVLDPLPTTVNREAFVLITGKLKTESGMPITFRTINLINDNDGLVATSTTTNSNGEFAFSWNVKYTYNTYRWYAEFTGDNQFLPSHSEIQSVSVKLYPDLYFTPLQNRILIGTPLEFSGQLTAEGLPLAGKTIYIKDDIDFGTDRRIVSTTTDQNGEFSITWDPVLRSSGSYDFYAVFEGDSEAFRARSATYSVYVSVTQVFEPVRVYTEKTVFSEGDSLRISGSATPNEELEIALVDSRENIIMQKSVRVGSTGLFSMEFFTWQSSSNLNFSVYRIIAWSPIDLRYDSLWVSFIQVEPETFQTKITLNRPPSPVILNEPITFTGQLLTTDGQPLTFTTVGIATITNQVPEALQIGTTDSSGKFSITWTSRYTSSSATIPVFAYFGGNQVFDHSISDSYSITIEKPTLSLFTEKTSYKAGELLIAYGYGNPGDTINVSLRSQQGQIMSNSVKVTFDGSYTIFFDLTGLSQGSYTVTAISSSFGITDSTTIFVEAEVIQETIDIVVDVYFTDQGRKIPLDGIKTVLAIGANQQIDYADSTGRSEFTNIKFDSRVDYLLYFEMTDGKSFNLVDERKYSSDRATNPNAYGQVIQSYSIKLPLDNTKETNYFSINLDDFLQYDFSDSNNINKAFSIQTKIVNFFSKVLGERPPMINIFLFDTGSSSNYGVTKWDTNTGEVAEGYWEPRIRILPHAVLISTLGMEYTHYAQDYAYSKMSGIDPYPFEGWHYGLNNPSSAAGWIEGVGSFVPGVIAQWENMPESGKFDRIILEDNKYKPNSEYQKWSGSLYWLDEEYSISNLLWDMYDNKSDDENISVNVREVWDLIKGFDSFQQHNPSDYSVDNERHVKYFKDFYDYLSDYSNIPQNEVDNLFKIHGIPAGWSAPGRP